MLFEVLNEKIGNRNATIVQPMHEIDSYVGGEIRKYVMTIIDTSDIVIIDFFRVTYLNSSGLRELIKLLKNILELDKNLILIHINDDIRRIFTHTNLERLFIIYDTIETAKHLLAVSKK